ncbi:hypothetical protein Tco_0662289 [Tanacetum coccineum]
MFFASSAITYTSVYTDFEPWRFYEGSDEEPSDIGSPGVIVYGYDGLPMHSVAAPSPNYEDPKEDHADYPADGGDGDDESSVDDDDEMIEDVRKALKTRMMNEVGESSTAVAAARQPGPALEDDLRRDKVKEMDYGITDTWDEIVEAMQEIATTTLEGDAQDDRAFLRARVNTLYRDRPYHLHTAMLLDREATYARRPWVGSEDRSVAIKAHTLEARDPEPQDKPVEAGSSC